MKYITKSFSWERVLSVRIIIPLRGQIWAFSELSKRSHVQANYATLSLSFFFVFSSAAWSKSPPDFHISVRHPFPVLLPGKSHRWRSLVDCSPWGREESDSTEQLHFHFSLSCIGEGNGNPLQCSCLENPRDGGAWWAAIYGVAQSRTRLKWLSSSSNYIRGFLGSSVGKESSWQGSILGWEDILKREMETHSNILAWRIPWAEESGRLKPMGSQESDMT